MIARAQGVGPKLAQRIVVELKDKPIAGAISLGLPQHVAPAVALAPSVSGEAVSALMGLGVAEPVARRVVEQAVTRLGEAAEIPAVVKAALQELGR
jgi:Holliday junction DNA helicase RuvA